MIDRDIRPEMERLHGIVDDFAFDMMRMKHSIMAKKLYGVQPGSDAEVALAFVTAARAAAESMESYLIDRGYVVTPSDRADSMLLDLDGGHN